MILYKYGMILEISLRVILAIIYFVSEKFIHPFIRIIPRPAWERILYPHKPDTVPIWLLAILAVITPILVGVLVHFVHRNYLKKNGWSTLIDKFNSTKSQFGSIFTRKNFLSADIIDFALAYSLNIVFNGVITNFLKLLVGRPRPDFFNRCYPNIDIYNSNSVFSQLDSITNNLNNLNCDPNNEKLVLEGRKSFPSGHSSTAFCSFGFVAFYIWGKTFAFSKKGYLRSWRFLSGFPFMLTALYVVVSRTQDYRHHWEDVTIGSLIGLFSAYYCYRLYYPDLTSNLCNFSYRQILWLKEFESNASSPDSKLKKKKMQINHELGSIASQHEINLEFGRTIRAGSNNQVMDSNIVT